MSAEPEPSSSNSAPWLGYEAPPLEPIHHPFMDYKTADDIQADFRDIILGLAEAFDGERLAVLRQENKWLDEFEPRFQEDQPRTDFKKSQTAFTNDGNTFLRVLEEYADLYHKESASRSLSRIFGFFFVPFIALILETYKAAATVENQGTLNLSHDFKTAIDRLQWDTDGWEQEFLGPHLNSDDDNVLKCRKRFWELTESRPFWYKYPKNFFTIEDFRDFFARAWESSMRGMDSKEMPIQDFFLHVGITSLTRNQQHRRFYNLADNYHDVGIWWSVFQANLQNFVSLVASKRGSLSVDENLQTLQAVNESRMRYVAIMQQTIQELNRTVSEQQQVITALKFRYLLENLPGPAYAHIDTLSGRWRAFWRDITADYRERETGANTAVTESLAAAESEALAEDAASAEGETAGGEGETAEGEDATAAAGAATTEDATAKEGHHPNTNPGLDKLFGGRFESKIEAKGQELYSDLSEIIHRYKGNNYEFDDLLFGPVTADILRALSPKLKKNGEVEWDKESLRYSHIVKAKEERKKAEEEKEKSDKTEPGAKKTKKTNWNQMIEARVHRLEQLEETRASDANLFSWLWQWFGRATHRPENKVEQVDRSPGQNILDEDEENVVGDLFD